MSKFVKVYDVKQTLLEMSKEKTRSVGWGDVLMERLKDLSIEVSEDAVSREYVVKKLKSTKEFYLSAWGSFSNMDDKDKARCDELNNCIATVINAPSVLPKPKEGKRSRCIWCDSPYRIEYNWIDREGNTASFADEDRHLVATGIANYCPNCGMKMKGDKE